MPGDNHHTLAAEWAAGNESDRRSRPSHDVSSGVTATVDEYRSPSHADGFRSHPLVALQTLYGIRVNSWEKLDALQATRHGGTHESTPRISDCAPYSPRIRSYGSRPGWHSSGCRIREQSGDQPEVREHSLNTFQIRSTAISALIADAATPPDHDSIVSPEPIAISFTRVTASVWEWGPRCGSGARVMTTVWTEPN